MTHKWQLLMGFIVGLVSGLLSFHSQGMKGLLSFFDTQAPLKVIDLGKASVVHIPIEDSNLISAGRFPAQMTEDVSVHQVKIKK